MGAQAQNVQSAASRSGQEPKRSKCSKGESKSSAATQSTHGQLTLNTTTDLTVGGGGDAWRVLRVLTVFEPEPLNKDQYDIQGGNWKASAKEAPHALTQEGKKAVDIKADGNCWLAGPYQAMHPTEVYPKLDIKAKEMRGSAGTFSRRSERLSTG